MTQTAFADSASTGALAQLQRELESLPQSRCLTDADAEAVYSLAYREFGQARYEEALRYFQLLLIYRPTAKTYLLGAALCLQRLRRYEPAILVFSALGVVDAAEPSHTLAVAECQLLCHKREEARQTLGLVIDFCRASAAHEKVLARAQAMLELMRSQHEPAAA
jgi:type III secretion system low calcium response chaperone LcrH/SycD